MKIKGLIIISLLMFFCSCKKTYYYEEYSKYADTGMDAEIYEEVIKMKDDRSAIMYGQMRFDASIKHIGNEYKIRIGYVIRNSDGYPIVEYNAIEDKMYEQKNMDSLDKKQY